jgi:hypothetical protein
MLLYAFGNFLQVLEGDESATDEVFAKISADDRHHDILVISEVIGPLPQIAPK